MVWYTLIPFGPCFVSNSNLLEPLGVNNFFPMLQKLTLSTQCMASILSGSILTNFRFLGGHFRFGGHWNNHFVTPPWPPTSFLASNLRRGSQIQNLEPLKLDFWWFQSLGSGQELQENFVMGKSL